MFIVAFTSSYLLVAQETAVSAQECIKNYQLTEQSIKSHDVRLEVTTRLFFDADENGKRFRLASSKVNRFHYRQVANRNEGRIETLSPDGSECERICVYDRKVDRIFYPKTQTMDVLDRRSDAVDQWHDYLISYRSVFGRISLAKTFSDRKSVKCVTLSDSNLVMLTAEPQPNANVTHPNNIFRVVLSMRDGYLPNVIEELIPVGETFRLYRKTEVLQRMELAQGISVPTKLVTRLYLAKYPGLENEVVWESEICVNTKDSKWNSPIPEGTFDLPQAVRTKDIRKD